MGIIRSWLALSKKNTQASANDACAKECKIRIIDCAKRERIAHAKKHQNDARLKLNPKTSKRSFPCTVHNSYSRLLSARK
jgi:hypothetical protein